MTEQENNRQELSGLELYVKALEISATILGKPKGKFPKSKMACESLLKKYIPLAETIECHIISIALERRRNKFS